MKNMFVYMFKNCNLLQYDLSGRARKEIYYTGGHSPALVYAITEDNGAICGVMPKSLRKIDKDIVIKETPLIKNAADQIEEYLNKKRKSFDLPLKPEGTEFQIKVWKALQQIPYGETCSYGDIAAAIGNPKASRAVGMANNKNPIHIIIPCHRVIGANGSLVGYAGGIEVKKMLLELEAN